MLKEGPASGGYCRDRSGVRNYKREAQQNLLAQQSSIIDVSFVCGDYSSFIIPPKSLIYCDPPYRGTTKYGDKFDHDAFYKWCREKVCEGHTLFLSEYSAPSDFECIFEKQLSSNLDVLSKGKKAQEKLFRYKI